MDEEELSRHVVVAARGELRPDFRVELWSELAAELEGSSLPLPSSPTDRVRRRRWMAAVGAFAAAVVAVAGAVALWPQDESTLRDVGGVDSTALLDVTTVPEPSTPVTEATIPTTTVPEPTTTGVGAGLAPPAERRLEVRPTGGEPVEALAAAGCDASGTCFDGGTSTVLSAPPDSEITVGGVLGSPTAETDSFGSALPLPMLPRRDGTWVLNQPIGSQELTVTIRDDHPDGSWAAFEVTVSPSGDPMQPPDPIEIPAPRSLEPAAEPPADLPDLVVGARGADLVRLDRATGAETVLVDDVGGAIGDDLGCSDSCGISQVSVSADGRLAVYGGPGPAVGQLYVVPTDGSSDPGYVFGGGSPGALAPDGSVAVGVLGSLLVGQTDGAAPVQDAAGRLLGTSNIAPAFAADGTRLFAAVATATGTDVVALDPDDLEGAIEPVISAVGVRWTVLAARADGTLAALRQLPLDAGQVVVDVIDPASGTVVDSIVLESNSSPTQPVAWIDTDATGRYLLFTNGAGQLQWTDFASKGVIGEGWGDAGW